MHLSFFCHVTLHVVCVYAARRSSYHRAAPRTFFILARTTLARTTLPRTDCHYSDSKMGRSSLLVLFLWALCLAHGQSPSTSVPVPDCPPGFEFQECGTACPQTCADVPRPRLRPCTLQCVRGEECTYIYAVINV